MSKLDELLRELCPDGVEYKTLGEIATDIYRGAGITRDQVTAEGTPCVRYGEIYTTYGVWFDKCVSHTDESKLASKKYFEYGDILFVITGESVEDIAKCCAYVGHEKCLAGGDIVVLKHNQDPKYLSYALATTDARQQKSKGKVKSKVVHSSVPAIREIKIPVPPIEIQREIVCILDNFTNLTAELVKELTARKTQYGYYRNKFLDFESSVSVKTIGDICDVVVGGEPPTDCIKGDVRDSTHIYPVWGNGKEVYGYSGTYKIDRDAVVISSIGANTGAVYYKEAFFTPIIRLKVILPKDNRINARFLFHALSGTTIKSKSSSVPNMNAKEIKAIKIPVPPLDVQNRIVNVLDNFEKICSDLNIGLPAEIEARQKQYEYYRDKLLTFAETGNTILSRAEQSRAEQSRAEQSRAEH